MSYTIDIYQKKLQPTRNVLAFFAFVSFFPQLVAGPIERASNLLPQFFEKKIIKSENIKIGLKFIVWGLFKKMVIADNCAEYVNVVFNNYGAYNASTLVLAVIFFAFQIYGDFSGYSDIAIGTARLFGFRLMKNFAQPYFARDIAEFWRRWHISLTTWFRDYVYIPLGGSQGSKWQKISNTLIIFLVSGFWHGANWTFLAWGTLNAVFFLPLLLTNTNRKNTRDINHQQLFPTIREMLQIAVTFSLVSVSWIFFRSQTIPDAFNYISIIFSTPIISDFRNFHILPFLLLILVLIEWFTRNSENGLDIHKKIQPVFRYAYYSIILSFIAIFAYTDKIPFIYFQF